MMVIKCPKHNLQHDLWNSGKLFCNEKKKARPLNAWRHSVLTLCDLASLFNWNWKQQCILKMPSFFGRNLSKYYTNVFEQSVRKSENRRKIYSQNILNKPGNSHKTNTTQIIQHRFMVVNFILSDWQDMPCPCAFVLQHRNVIALCSRIVKYDGINIDHHTHGMFFSKVFKMSCIIPAACMFRTVWVRFL